MGGGHFVFAVSMALGFSVQRAGPLGVDFQKSCSGVSGPKGHILFLGSPPRPQPRFRTADI